MTIEYSIEVGKFDILPKVLSLMMEVSAC